jgi:hypothetical protein
LPHEEDGTPLQALVPMLPVVAPLECDDIMNDDILARDRSFAVNSDEGDIEAGETDDTEIDDDPGLDLEWPLDEERTGADAFWRSAREGLIEVMNQFRVRPEGREEIQGIFEWCITGVLLDLGFSPIPGENRFAWRLRLSNPWWHFIADLGKRFDALVSSEVITERTNGVMAG